MVDQLLYIQIHHSDYSVCTGVPFPLSSDQRWCPLILIPLLVHAGAAFIKSVCAWKCVVDCVCVRACVLCFVFSSHSFLAKLMPLLTPPTPHPTHLMSLSASSSHLPANHSHISGMWYKVYSSCFKTGLHSLASLPPFFCATLLVTREIISW